MDGITSENIFDNKIEIFIQIFTKSELIHHHQACNFKRSPSGRVK